MVRDNRIKEKRFSVTADSATTETIFTPDSVNGEILDVQWAFNRAGSIALSFSGTGIEFFRRNVPSGAGWQTTPPRQLTQSVTGSVIDAEVNANFNAHEPLALDVTGLASGTQILNLNVRYR